MPGEAGKAYCQQIRALRSRQKRCLASAAGNGRYLRWVEELSIARTDADCIRLIDKIKSDTAHWQEEAAACADQERQVIKSIMHVLPDETDQEIARLRYCEGLTIEAIAERLYYNDRTVNRKLARIHQRIEEARCGERAAKGAE